MTWFVTIQKFCPPPPEALALFWHPITIRERLSTLDYPPQHKKLCRQTDIQIDTQRIHFEKQTIMFTYICTYLYLDIVYTHRYICSQCIIIMYVIRLYIWQIRIHGCTRCTWKHKQLKNTLFDEFVINEFIQVSIYTWHCIW